MEGLPCGFGDKTYNISMSVPLHLKWNALGENLRSRRRVLIAFSGGCDSSFLLAAAVRTLGRDHVLGVTAVSPSLPSQERDFTRQLAERWNARYLALETDELTNPSYASNPSNRCFFCKDELFEKLTPVAQSRGMVVADGFNASDRADFRPGYQASQKWGVAHPLDEVGLTKRDIRTLSRWLRLPTWNKPASPCLSSRIPYGTAVTEKILRQIEQAEAVVRSEGFRVVRVEMEREAIPS